MSQKISEDILEALRKGDHKAFETIFLAYFNQIKVFINGLIKSEADAEELTEELFVNLWSNRATIDPRRSFHSYLHTIAYNAAINFLKHKYVQHNYQQISVKTEEEYSCEDELIARETSLLIDMAVEKMPEQRRRVFRLSKKEGLKNDEIADRLQTTKRTVESQLSMALKELKILLRYSFLFLWLFK